MHVTTKRLLSVKVDRIVLISVGLLAIHSSWAVNLNDVKIKFSDSFYVSGGVIKSNTFESAIVLSNEKHSVLSQGEKCFVEYVHIYGIPKKILTEYKKKFAGDLVTEFDMSKMPPVDAGHGAVVLFNKLKQPLFLAYVGGGRIILSLPLRLDSVTYQSKGDERWVVEDSELRAYLLGIITEANDGEDSLE